MSTNKIFCFGDGYVTGHIWPEWPQILQVLFPDTQVEILGGVGAGPEFLVSQFAEHIPYDNATVIFQWPIAERFDKIIQDQYWKDIVTNDPVYHFNTHSLGGLEWWLSSASSNLEIKQYHQKYVQSTQARYRLKIYQQLVKEILDKTQNRYLFITTSEQEKYSRKFHSEIRGHEIQPSPLSHFYFLTEQIMPAVNLYSDRCAKLEQLLINTKWQPYDPDRGDLWIKIQQDLNQVSK